jgi:hypothetical protein
MNAQEAEPAYRIAKGQLDARQITVEEYNRRVAELKYQDNVGSWWAVSPQDGSWLKWTGSAWVPAFTQAVPVTMQATVQPASQPAVQPDVQQPAAQPSWYIPPSGVQQKPATQPAAAQPVKQPVYQQHMPQPAATVVAQPAATSVKQPWSKGKKFAVVSIVCGIGAFIFIPYIFGILGVILGALSLREKYNPGAVGILVCIVAMLINYLYIFIF